MDTSYGWFHPAADYGLRLTWVPAAGYELQLTASYGWLAFRRLGTTQGWFHPVTDYKLWLTWVPAARYKLQLIPSCGWPRVAADFILRLSWVSPAGLDLRLSYTLIYQVNLRIYSAKYIIFMVGFLPRHHWFRLWLLFREPWRSLKKLEETWRSFKILAVTDSSCSGRFEVRRLIWELRPIDYLQNFDPDAPW